MQLPYDDKDLNWTIRSHFNDRLFDILTTFAYVQSHIHECICYIFSSTYGFFYRWCSFFRPSHKTQKWQSQCLFFDSPSFLILIFLLLLLESIHYALVQAQAKRRGINSNIIYIFLYSFIWWREVVI